MPNCAHCGRFINTASPAWMCGCEGEGASKAPRTLTPRPTPTSTKETTMSNDTDILTVKLTRTQRDRLLVLVTVAMTRFGALTMREAMRAALLLDDATDTHVELDAITSELEKAQQYLGTDLSPNRR